VICLQSFGRLVRPTQLRRTEAMHTRNFHNALVCGAKAAVLLTPLMGPLGWAATLEAPFTRLITGPWMEASKSICVASCDYDNNGWPDLFVGNMDGASALYRNENGTFTKVTAGPIPTLLPTPHAAAWADYDNDGWPDLVVACIVDAPGRATVLFNGLGNGSHQRVLDGPLLRTRDAPSPPPGLTMMETACWTCSSAGGRWCETLPTLCTATKVRQVFCWTM
jgi:hypothetical protein